MAEQEIRLGDELVKVDDQRTTEYKYKNMTVTYKIDNGQKSFIFPLRYANHKDVTISEEEGKVLYSILQDAYGKENE